MELVPYGGWNGETNGETNWIHIKNTKYSGKERLTTGQGRMSNYIWNKTFPSTFMVEKSQ